MRHLDGTLSTGWIRNLHSWLSPALAGKVCMLAAFARAKHTREVWKRLTNRAIPSTPTGGEALQSQRKGPGLSIKSTRVRPVPRRHCHGAFPALSETLRCRPHRLRELSRSESRQESAGACTETQEAAAGSPSSAFPPFCCGDGSPWYSYELSLNLHAARQAASNGTGQVRRHTCITDPS